MSVNAPAMLPGGQVDPLSADELYARATDGVGSAPATSDAVEMADTALAAPLSSALHARLRSDPRAWRRALGLAFGGKAAPAELDALARAGESGDLPLPARVRFLSSHEFAGHERGAYAGGEGGTVYLDERLLADPAALERVFAEEVGHHLDAVLGGPDARGDEGAIFAEALLGRAAGRTRGAGGADRPGETRSERLERLRTENDHGTLTVDGRQIAVEFDRDVEYAILDEGMIDDAGAFALTDLTATDIDLDVGASFELEPWDADTFALPGGELFGDTSGELFEDPAFTFEVPEEGYTDPSGLFDIDDIADPGGYGFVTDYLAAAKPGVDPPRIGLTDEALGAFGEFESETTFDGRAVFGQVPSAGYGHALAGAEAGVSFSGLEWKAPTPATPAESRTNEAAPTFAFTGGEVRDALRERIADSDWEATPDSPFSSGNVGAGEFHIADDLDLRLEPLPVQAAPLMVPRPPVDGQEEPGGKGGDPLPVPDLPISTTGGDDLPPFPPISEGALSLGQLPVFGLLGARRSGTT